MSTPSPVRDARILRNVSVSMRDGVKLATTVCLPPAEGRYPAVLVRSAYGRVWGPGALPQKGIALVTQDCRGRYGSEGDFYPFRSEPNDGYDTLEWLVAQPWCDGRVAMFGDSYLAATQFAVAPLRHPALRALNPRFMAGDTWRTGYYCGGAFSLALSFSWLALEVASRTSEAGLLPFFNVAALVRHLPLRTIDEACGGPAPAYRDCVDHWTYDDYWKAINYRDELPKANVPMLLTGGWYDYYAGETFRNYAALLTGPDSELRRKHRVLMGPWTHGINPRPQLGQIDFGPEAIRENDSTDRWLEAMLTHGDPARFQPAPIRLFVMGINQWRDEQEWPLARTRFVRYHLHSGGAANSLIGDGRLSADPPGDEAPDRYTYDPGNPVPTLGGNHSVGPYNPGLYELALPGPYDQRPIERRDDVLVYTSDELPEDLEVTGPIEVRLFASSSAVDTDFTARLSDVFPDGRAVNLTEGVVRARFRARQWDRPSLLEPGKVEEYVIELQPTSNVFRQGHRIRLDISSSNFPLWDRNLNTGEQPGRGTSWVRAEQTVHHDRRGASCVVLPVIPRG